jgi:hypothetical protein
MVTLDEENIKRAKAISWVLLIIAWGLYFGTDISNATKDAVFYSSIMVTIITLFLTFGEDYYKNIGKKRGSYLDNIPEPMAPDEIKEVIEIEVGKRWNNILKGNPRQTRSKTVNGNTIYALKLALDLDDEEAIMIINANYHNRVPTLIPLSKENANISLYSDKVTNEMINIASNPFDEPNIEKTEESLDQFGNPLRRIERITRRVKNERAEKEDII